MDLSDQEVEKYVRELCNDPQFLKEHTLFPDNDLAYSVWESFYDRIQSRNDELTEEDENDIRELCGALPIAFIPVFCDHKTGDVQSAMALAHIGQCDVGNEILRKYRAIDGVQVRN